jgi:uncharacterized RDD family membrane protein YckC
MTDQPPPPPGPPPPPAGGYPPPPQGGGYPPQAPQGAAGYPDAGGVTAGLPQDAYTPWGTRVVAYIIDAIPVLVLEGIGLALLFGTRETVCISDTSEYNFCATGASTLGQVALAVTAILSLIYWIWNLGYRQGTTGSSIGKGIMKFKIVNENTGQPVGFGWSLLRELIYWLVAGVCAGIVWLVAVLFPLWDQKRQTLVDKILTHVALPI